MIHAFLLIGQSNAAGRGFISEAEPLDNLGGRLKILRNGRWQPMFRPVNPDRRTAGVCFAESFALEYAKAHPEADVGIIPCADGGTSLSQWEAGGALFDYAVACTRLAMRSSSVVGVLWHQGEMDCSDGCYPLYYDRFNKMKESLREALGLGQLPFVIGGLGDFLPKCQLDCQLDNYVYVNRELERIAADDPACAFASAEGLGSNPDSLHFSSSALLKFGIRYYNAFASLGTKPVTEHGAASASGDEVGEMEAL